MTTTYGPRALDGSPIGQDEPDPIPPPAWGCWGWPTQDAEAEAAGCDQTEREQHERRA